MLSPSRNQDTQASVRRLQSDHHFRNHKIIDACQDAILMQRLVAEKVDFAAIDDTTFSACVKKACGESGNLFGFLRHIPYSDYLNNLSDELLNKLVVAAYTRARAPIFRDLKYADVNLKRLTTKTIKQCVTFQFNRNTRDFLLNLKQMNLDLSWIRHDINNLVRQACIQGQNSAIIELNSIGEDVAASIAQDNKLKLACKSGNAQCVKDILTVLRLAPFDQKDQQQNAEWSVDEVEEDVVLTEAQQKAYTQYLPLLKVAESTDHCLLIETTRDGFKGNCLYQAIKENKKSVVEVLLMLHQDYVDELMTQNFIVQDGNRKRYYTDNAMKMIIRRMPDLASLTFDKKVCQKIPEMRSRTTSTASTASEDPLSDGGNMQELKPTKPEDVEVNIEDGGEDDECGEPTWMFDYKLLQDSQCACTECVGKTRASKTLTKKHHPLMLAYNKSNKDLAKHRLLLSLLYNKWRCIRPLHFITLFWYMAFAMAVTLYMMTSHKYKEGDEIYDQQSLDPTGLPDRDTSGSHQKILAFIICGMAIIGILVEILQLIILQKMYVENYRNILQNGLDWFMYLCTTWVAMVPIEGYRSNTQWEFGCACILICWFNLLLHHPIFSTYLYLIGEVIIELWRFTLMFLIFLMIFGLTFAALLNNQAPHNSVPTSMIRTWTMMLGDIGYTDLFHSDDELASVRYSIATYFLFVVFLLLGIVITNMWTGFIINRIEGMEEAVNLMKSRSQMDYILTWEFIFPNICKNCIVYNKTTFETRHRKRTFLRKILDFIAVLFGDLRYSREVSSFTQPPENQSSDQISMSDVQRLINEIQQLKRLINERNDNTSNSNNNQGSGGSGGGSNSGNGGSSGINIPVTINSGGTGGGAPAYRPITSSRNNNPNSRNFFNNIPNPLGGYRRIVKKSNFKW